MTPRGPSRISPLLVERIWGRGDLGGSRWRSALDIADDDGRPIGEAWLSDLRCGIEGGETLGALIAGGSPGKVVPPLLAKLLFTTAPLSVQVHPTDEAARIAGSSASGKDEAWHILEATADARVWVGLREPVSRDALRAAAEDGSILSLLRPHAARPGETILVPAGTVHAIGADIVLLEVQDPVDITYRLYDHGRPRELQLDAALDAADLGRSRGVVVGAAGAGVPRRTVGTARRFVLEICQAAAGFTLAPDGASDHILVALAAGATLDGRPLPPGAAAFVPAAGRPARLGGAPGATIALLHAGPGPSRCLIADRGVSPSRRADRPPA
jgi:mannose-6-phosphate isomerase